MKALIVALAFGVGLPVSAFAQDAPPFLKTIAPQAAVRSRRGFAGNAGLG